MGIASDLRASVLQAAIQGKLTEQLSTDGNARDLLAKIKAEKEQLIKDKKIKKEKALAPISDDEKPFDIPENWVYSQFGDLGVYRKGPFGSSLTKGMFVPKGENTIKVYEQKNAIQKNINLGDYYITKKYFEEKMQSFEVHTGDIIVSCAGTIGETYIVPQEHEQGIINQALMKMTLMPSVFVPYFLLYFDFILKDTARQTSKGSAIKNIPPFDELKRYVVPLPPLAEQERIVERVDALMKEIDELEKIETELEHIKKEFPNDMKAALLQSAMQGKLTQQLASDGRASEIFHNIGVEPIRDTSDMPFDIPENWGWMHITDFGTFLNGKTPKATDLVSDFDIPYFKVADMNTEGNEKYLQHTNCGVKASYGKTFPKGGFAYPKNGGAVFTNKKRILVQDSIVDLNTGVYVPSEHLNPDFAFLMFSTLDFRHLCKGTALPTIDMDKVRKICFPVPPLVEQERIVAQLDRLLPLCDSLNLD